MANLDLEQLFNESNCNINKEKSEAERKKGCTKKAKPGLAAGGCAFDGAQTVLLPVADAAHLVHGPISCSGNSWDNRGTRSAVSQFYRIGFTTDVGENDVIFGGEKKVINACKEIKQKYNPPAIFVYSTCVTAMIGDDLDSACKKASVELGIPVIPVHSPGFVGSKNLGNKLAGRALLEHVIGTGEPIFTTPYDINLIGEYNIAGELWQVMPIFRDLGIRILSSISGDSTYKELTYAHRSKLNVVICSKALVSLAEGMKQKYDIPFIEGSFYGMRETTKTILSIAEALGDEDLIKRAKEYTRKKEEETKERLKPHISLLRGKKVLLYTGGVKSWSMVFMLEELEMEVIGTSIRKSTEKDIEKLRHAFEKNQKALIEQGGAKDIIRIMEENKGDILLAGGRNMYTAIKGRYPFLDVNQERVYPFAGYDGLVEIAKHMVNTIYSPVWKYAENSLFMESAL